MKRVLEVGLGLTLAYILVTFFAGLRAHSLALLSEAGHNASDALALVISFAALWFGQKPANSGKTFGYGRAGVLAALFNSLTLVGIAISIAIEAVLRLRHPVPVETGIMMAVAAAGMLMNGFIALQLWRVGANDVNLRSTFIHMAGDALSTAAVLVGGAVIHWTNLYWLDPALSLAIAALIFWSSIGIARESMNILLEGTPRGLSLVEVQETLGTVEGVRDVHDLHIWSLGSESHALSTHVCIADIPLSESSAILARIREVLRQRFHITHTTIQFENLPCATEHGCVASTAELAAAGHGHHHHHHGHAHHDHSHDGHSHAH